MPPLLWYDCTGNVRMGHQEVVDRWPGSSNDNASTRLM
jgi:hypothetical protein